MESSEMDDMMCIEVKINSVEPDFEKEDVEYAGEPSVKQSDTVTLTPVKTSKKRTKRKSNDTIRESSTSKKFCSSESSDEGTSPKKIKRSPKSKKSYVGIEPSELRSVLEGMDDEIDHVLEETAHKNRLTAANVKNILRHVITNEYVLAMVRNTMKSDMNEENLEGAVFEPKLTRSKVKELREKQHILPWPILTPVQAEPESKVLLEEEFSDEGSSDEDYKPNEEECPSEEDIVQGSAADLDTSITAQTASPFTKPQDDADDDIGLIIALPESEYDPEQRCSSVDNEVDKIALRTRSKLPLNDTPLEAIEASFVAPDIDVDLYDTNCDDKEWLKFLKELSIGIPSKPDEPDVDDVEEDPEYNALEDEDVPDNFDYRFDNSVKVPMKELNALMAEIYDQPEFNDNDEDDEENEEQPEISTNKILPPEENPEKRNKSDQKEVKLQNLNNEFEWPSCETNENMALEMEVPLTQRTELITHQERLQLEEQIRMDEIKMFSSNGSTLNEKSAFQAHNLDGALDIINQFENGKNKITVRPYYRKSMLPGIYCQQAKKTIANSKVFMYPELLPKCGLRCESEAKKACFTPAEDFLIAIGLEEFSFAVSPVNYIHNFLVPVKTEDQIKIRIKNSKTKGTLGNPIKHYLMHGQCPPIEQTVRTFDPSNIKAPKDQPRNMLPKWLISILPEDPLDDEVNRMDKSPLMMKPILPKPFELIISLKNEKTAPPKRKYRPLLPRKVHFSPLKHISPILKKYNQKRLMSSTNNNVNANTKSVGFAKKLVIKPTLISLKPAGNRKGVISKDEPKRDNLNSVVTDVNGEIENANPNRLVKNLESSSPNTIKKKELSRKDASRSASEVNGDECDGPAELEATEENDEEMMEDEPESSAPQQDSISTSIVSSKKHSVTKKKNKQQRDLESSLALLKPNLVENDPKREERELLFANSYLLRVHETLKEDTETWEKFLNVLWKYQNNTKSPVKLYFEIKDILKDFPELADDFVAFLNTEQAKECGKYKEFVILCKIRTFIRKVESHFQNQPQHLLKILRTFAQFRQQSSIKSADVLIILQPLLKNQSHLIEELTNLLPDLAPSESLMTDIEDVTIPNSDDDNSSIDSCEEIVIPEQVDLYGGKDCPCDCHVSSTEAKVLNKIRHCVKCGVKFMDGRVYIQTGKVLKPAQVVYHDTPPEPVPISNGDVKVASKNKLSGNSPGNKIPVASDLLSKQEVSQTKKDTAKTPNLPQPPVLHSNNPVPSTSNLPSDVIEDTVFPVLSTVSKENSIPSDFSHLKDVIESANEKDGNSSEQTKPTDPTDVKEGPVNQTSTTTCQKAEWSKEEDKLIIYNCQRFGATEKAFEVSSVTLENRTPKEVQERFLYLMDLLCEKFNIH